MCKQISLVSFKICFKISLSDRVLVQPCFQDQNWQSITTYQQVIVIPVPDISLSLLRETTGFSGTP